MGSMLFLDTISCKLDAKYRICIPASYRRLFEEQKTEIVLYPSFTQACLEGCTVEMLNHLNQQIHRSFSLFSQEETDLGGLIFAACKTFVPDATGRIGLPEKMITHAGLKEDIVFVGKGQTFQIWDKDAWEVYQTGILNRQKARPLTIPFKESAQ